MLYAFEQMIINTEDGAAEDDYYDEQYGEEEGDEDQMMLYQQYQMQMYNPMGRVPIENEYLSNPSDIIDEEEEELEESQEEP